MNIDADTKELIDKALNGAFPQRGKYFYATRRDGIRDYSYIDDVFKCDGADPIMVVARCITDLRTEQFRLNRNHYTFSQVSEEVLNALGIYLSANDTSRVSIAVDPHWMVPGFECVRIGQPQHGELFIFNGNIYCEGDMPGIDLLTHEPMAEHPALPLVIVKKIIKCEERKMNDETQKMELTINNVADINIKVPKSINPPQYSVVNHIKIELGYGDNKTEYAYFYYSTATNAAVAFDAIVSELKKIRCS